MFIDWGNEESEDRVDVTEEMNEIGVYLMN